MTSCPHVVARRLIQPECVPVSRATRAGECELKYSRRAAWVVRRRVWLATAPSRSSTQISLNRSPTSIPIARSARGIAGRRAGFVLRPGSAMLCFMGRSPFNALRVRKGAFSKSSFWGPAFSFHLSSCVAAAMLAGCGGSQPPIGAPGAALQSSAIGTQVDHGGSWMAPEAKSEDLLYVGNTQGGPSGTGYITVYSY